MTNFNELYKVHEHPWGSVATSTIPDVAPLFKPGSVVDIGVGDGRNVLLLAEQGFTITGVDIAPEAIAKLQQYAQERGVEQQVTGVVADVAEYQPPFHDNVMSHFTLHFLSKQSFPLVLQRLQGCVPIGGIHLISDFTQDGPLYRPDTGKYWLKPGELERLYGDWEILKYAEQQVRTRARDENGNHYHQMAATLVARKK